MLGLLLLYFIGKQFYKLAEAYRKNGWGFAIAGVAAYYASAFVAGILILIANEWFNPGSFEEINDNVLSLIAMPFGLLGCWALYRILKNSWAKKPATISPDILDDEIL